MKFLNELIQQKRAEQETLQGNHDAVQKTGHVARKSFDAYSDLPESTAGFKRTNAPKTSEIRDLSAADVVDAHIVEPTEHHGVPSKNLGEHLEGEATEIEDAWSGFSEPASRFAFSTRDTGSDDALENDIVPRKEEMPGDAFPAIEDEDFDMLTDDLGVENLSLEEDFSVGDDEDQAGQTSEMASTAKQIDAPFELPKGAMVVPPVQKGGSGDIEHETAADPEFTAVVDTPPLEDTQRSDVRDEIVAVAPEAPSEGSPDHAIEQALKLHIWDVAADEADAAQTEETEAANDVDANVSPSIGATEPPVEQATPRRAGRTRTRLLGFHRPDECDDNPFDRPQSAASTNTLPTFPVAWLVIEKGPGRGASFALMDGVSRIGRGDDQAVQLNFGDTSVSRDNHAVIAYDNEQRSFYIGHGGKANLVRLNGMPVLSTEELGTGDRIRIGETGLRFVALCGPDFEWIDRAEHGGLDVAAG